MSKLETIDYVVITVGTARDGRHYLHLDYKANGNIISEMCAGGRSDNDKVEFYKRALAMQGDLLKW